MNNFTEKVLVEFFSRWFLTDVIEDTKCPTLRCFVK